MTIQDLIAIILAKIKFIIIMAIIGGVAAFCVADFLMPIKYATSVKIYVKSSANTGTGTTTTTELTTARTLAETYIIILGDNSVYERVADKFMEEYEAEELEKVNIPLEPDEKGNLRVSPSYIKGCVSIASVNESEVLQISATTQIPQIAADICNYMVEVAPDVLRRVTKAGSVEEISAPEVPTAPSSPNVKKITVMGILVGIIGSMALVIILIYFNNKVMSSSDIREKFDVPILAEIPNFDIKNKKGVYKS